MKNLAFALSQPLRYSFAKTALKQPFMRIDSSAVQRLKQIMSESQDKQLVGVKISLTKKGCQGLSYGMDYIRDEHIKKFDQVIEEAGIKVVIDSKAVMALIGTQMKFQTTELGSQFVFDNPNQKGRCGCGQSFHL